MGAVGRLGNTFKGSSLTFSATLKRVEEEIRATSSEQIAEVVRGYTAGVKEQALSLQNFTDAGLFVAHMLQTVTSHRMHVVMACQRFSAASMELLLAPLVSEGHNAITMASFLQWFARDMHRSIQEDVLRRRESEARVVDSEQIDTLEDLERQRHKEAELMCAKAKQASMLLAISPKPGAGTVPSSGNTSKDSGVGSQFSGSHEFTPPGVLGAAPQSSPLKRRRKSTPKSSGTSLKWDCYPTYLSTVFECYTTRDTGEHTLILEDDPSGFAKESMLGLYYLFPHAGVSRYSVTIPIPGTEKKKTFSEAFCPFCDFKISKHDILNYHICMHLRMFLICRVDGCFHIEQECAAMWNHGTTVHSGKVKKGKPATQKRLYNRISSGDEAED